MTGSAAEARARLVRAAEGMHMTTLRLRHELDRVLAECGADDLLRSDSHGGGQVLVTASSLLMVLQSDILEVLEARALVSGRVLAEARTVMAALSFQMAGHDGARPPSTKIGADKPPRAG